MSPTDFVIGSAGTWTLVLPGWLVARARLLPHSLLPGFIISVVALVWMVLALDAFGSPLTIEVLGGVWAIFIVAAAFYWRRCHRSATRLRPPEEFSWKETWPLLLPLGPMLAVAAYR